MKIRLLLHFLLLPFLLLALLLPANAQLTSPVKIDQFITQVMDSANVPGLSVALIHNDKLAYSQGYGLVKSDSSQKVTASTVFDAASLSKPVFAYAVLQLVDEGKIDLDKPLYQYLPYPDAESDERYKLITARMVVSHRSGFPNWRGSQKLATRNPPGQRFGYSGEGFVYLQKVVESITGKPLNDLMNERVFKPLRMTRSGYVWQPDFDSDFARPHNNFGFPESKRKPNKANTAYSLQTTADDYAKFVLAILDGKGLKPATWNQMLSPQTKLPNEFDGDSTLSASLSWGLGIGLEKTLTGDYFWHWGDNGTFRCFVAARLKNPKNPTSTDAALVYFTNSFNGLSITGTMLAHLLGGSHPSVAFLDYEAYTTPSNLFARNILKVGVSEAIIPFLNAENKSTIPEDKMNRTGNRLLGLGRVNEALEVFKYNVEAYPASANVYYNYGLGQLRNGNQTEAVDYFNKATVIKADVGKAKQVWKPQKKPVVQQK
jgi:CubicO group peptidase (beta-lactamase class C family)